MIQLPEKEHSVMTELSQSSVGLRNGDAALSRCALRRNDHWPKG
jgi:hypothetical protein